jgi:hypothetical protein
MRYQKSKSLKEFENQIRLLTAELNKLGSNKNYSAKSKELLISAVISISFAHIENYLADLIDSWVDLTLRSNIEFSKIPVELRTFLFIKTQEMSYQNYLLTNNEKKLIENVNISKPSYVIVNDQGLISKINSKVIYGDKKYPSPDNMETLFNRLGVKNVFHKLNKRCKTDMKLVLASFNDIRTSIVHQGIQPGTNYRDFKKKLREITVLIRNLDIVFFQYVVKQTKNGCWVC